MQSVIEAYKTLGNEMFKVLQYLLIEHCMLKSMFPLIYFAKDTFILLTRHFHSKVIFYETMK